MMVKLSTEYYNLEKVAEVLSVPMAEVNRLREQSKLRGFRDGTDWKFLKEEVHDYLAKTIKARSSHAGNGQKPGDSDFDILGSDGAASSFDLLVEKAAPLLPDDDQLVSVSSQTRPASDLDLAALDNDDELALAEETRISAATMPQKGKKTEIEEDSSEVALSEETRISAVTMPQKGKKTKIEEDSSEVALAEETRISAITMPQKGKKPSSASRSDAILLDDHESVLGAGSSSPQLGLAGDSGFDVLVAGEVDSDLFEVDSKTLDGDSNLLEVDSKTLGGDSNLLEVDSKTLEGDSDLLEVAEEKTSVVFTSEEFSLEPSASATDGDDSESSSQVIAINAGFSGAGQNDPFGESDFGASVFEGFDSGILPPQSGTTASDPFGTGTSSFPDSRSASTALVSPRKPLVAVEEYSPGVLLALICVLGVMLVPGYMLIDTMVYMWSWGDPYVLNSLLMDTIAGWFGL